jgi:hypothetical protein
MATTSGTATFNMNRNAIITMALRKIGAIASGETPDPQTIQDASDALNVMVKEWDASGLHIWTETEGILFAQPSQYQYTIGSGSTDACADLTGSFNSTTLSLGAAANATSINVASATGFAASYSVGVVLDSGSIFWTTESGSPSGTTITLAAGLTSSASSGNAVYVYQTNAIRPLRVVSGRRFQLSSQIDTQMIQMSRIDYRNQPNKTSTGTITQFYYDPRGGTNAQGQMFLWPAPSDATYALKFTWWRPIQDFASAANIPDLPNEWLAALVWNLALEMAPEYDVPDSRYAKLQARAAVALDRAAGWDREPESYFFGADMLMR